MRNLEVCRKKIEEDGISKEFEVMFKKKYSHEKNYEFIFESLKVAYNFCISSNHISAEQVNVIESGHMVGTVTLVMDDRLKDGEAFFGFLEFQRDNDVFNMLWEELVVAAKEKGIKKLLGPVNGSIWHQYRCTSKSLEVSHILTEPCNPIYYYHFLKDKVPSKEIGFSSGRRKTFNRVIRILKIQSFINLFLGRKKSFSIELKKEVSIDDMSSIIEIALSSFKESSWGYTSLTTDEVLSLYDTDSVNENMSHLYFLKCKDKKVGFCSILKDGDIWTCKTICIKPEYQGVGLGNEMALRIHKDAQKSEVSEIRYLLVRDNNQVCKYPMNDLEIFRRYSAFEFNL